MYSVRAHLLLKMIKTTNDLDLDTAKAVFDCKMKDLNGVLLSCDLPRIECCDLFYKSRVRRMIIRLKELYVFFSNAKYPKDLVMSQVRFLKLSYPEISDYCDFYFGGKDVLLSSIIPLFCFHLSRIITNLESNLVGLRDDYSIPKINKDFCLKIKNYVSYLGDELSLSRLLTLLDDEEQRVLIFNLGMFIKKNFKNYEKWDLCVLNDFIENKLDVIMKKSRA